MSAASTPVPLSEAKTHLSELTRRVRQQHERITLTRNGEPEAVLLSVDDLDGLEMTLEILGDTEAVARVSESLSALERGEPGVDLATVRRELARRRHRRVTRASDDRYDLRFQPAARRTISSRLPEPSPPRCSSSATAHWQSARTASAIRCLVRSPAATAPAAAPIGSSTASTRPAESCTTSISTTVPTSTGPSVRTSGS